MKKFKSVIATCLLAFVSFIGAVGCKEDTPSSNPPPHAHTYSTTLSKDETHHWYSATCEHTNEVKGKTEHTFNEGVTQENGDIIYTCTACGYTKTTVHTHTYSTTLSKDETHHWYSATCGHASVEKDKATHIFDAGVLQTNGGKLYTCTACGYSYTKLEIKARLKNANATWHRTQEIAPLIEVMLVNEENQTDGDWLSITSDNITAYTITETQIKVTVCVTIANKAYCDEVIIPLSPTLVSVNALLSQPVNADYLVTGVVVAFATTVNENQILIADRTTGDIIAVTALGEGEVVWGSFVSDGLEVGDEVVLPVKLLRKATSSANADSNKLYAKYIGENLTTAVVSKDNSVSFTESPTVIDSQADLNEFLSSANRTTNAYKRVKLRGEMNFILNADYEAFEFWFYDNQADEIDDLKIDGLFPVFSNASVYYGTGKNFSDLVFGNKLYPNDIASPENIIIEIEALYLGGNDAYTQFVILDGTTVKKATPELLTTTLTAPKETTYPMLSTLNLTGAKITYTYDISSSVVVEVTEDMLDETTIPDFTTPGVFRVEGTHENYDFYFDIEVLDVQVSSIQIATQPTKTVYSHREKFGELDLTGATLRVNYSDSTNEVIPITSAMLNLDESDAWQIGEVDYAISYLGKTTALTVTYEYQTVSIAQFKQGTVGSTYELTGIVVGAVSSHAYAEILLKSKTTNDMISVANTGVAGAYNAPALDTSVLKAGDEIVISATLYYTSTSAKDIGNRERYHATVVADEFKQNLIILSSNNAVTYDLTGVTEISTQEQLVTFLNSSARFYSIVKFTGLKAVYASGKGYRIFFGNSVTSDATQKINTISPLFFTNNANNFLTKDISSYFTNNKSTSYSSPATANCDIYAVLLGGNSYYHDFAILDDSWMVTK